MRKFSAWVTALCLMCSAVIAAPQDAPAPTPTTPALEESAPATPVRDENGFYVGGPVYVSYNNEIWTRSGPSTRYRIVGSLPIGTKLAFIAYSRDKSFMQVEDENGKRFWMGTKTLQAENCGPAREQELLQQIATLQEKLNNYDSQLKREVDTLSKKNARLETENNGMKQAIAQKDQTIEELDELRRDYEDRLQTKELDMQMRWWLQGAIIAFCGILVGVIFVYLPRPSRKKRRERY